MWRVDGNNLQMVEGDYGMTLPVEITGSTLGSADSIKFTFKAVLNGSVVLEKDFDSITDNTVELQFTEAESGLFHVGSYLYSLDWYQDGRFMCNIIPAARFKVVDKV